MGKSTSLLLLSGIAMLLLVGCQTTIPPKIQVHDVNNGKTYTTYRTWGHVSAGRAGYEFTDLETGKKISVPNCLVSSPIASGNWLHKVRAATRWKSIPAS